MTEVSSNRISSQKKPDPCSFVIFGVTGDLAHALTRHLEDATDFFERVGVAVADAVAELDDLALAVGEGFEHLVDALAHGEAVLRVMTRDGFRAAELAFDFRLRVIQVATRKLSAEAQVVVLLVLEDALGVLEQKEYALVITDLTMPHVDGRALVRHRLAASERADSFDGVAPSTAVSPAT